MKKLFVFSCVMMLAFSMAGPANATLWDRGGGLIYDDVLDITWLQDARYARTSGYDQSITYMDWDAAVAWADSLVYGGYDDWRLPNTPGTGIGTTYEGEIGYMWHYNLGGGLWDPVTQEHSDYNPEFIDGNGNIVSFINTGGKVFYGQEDGLTSVWAYAMSTGEQTVIAKDSNWVAPNGFIYGTVNANAWAVRPGDSTGVPNPVPEPASIVLLGTGLLGAAGFRKKYKWKGD